MRLDPARRRHRRGCRSRRDFLFPGGGLNPWPWPAHFRGSGLRAHQRALIHFQEARQPLAVGVAFDRVWQVFDQRQHLPGNFRFDPGILQVTSGGQRTHYMHDDRLGVFDQAFPLFRVALDDFVRVESIRHGGHAQVGLQTGFVAQQPARIETQFIRVVETLAGRFQPAQDGFLTGRIRVERQHDPARKPLEQAQLLLGQGGAHRGNNVFIARLVDGDHVQVAFHDDGLVGCPDGLARPVQPVEQAALAEERRLGRVHELGEILRVEDARPKAAHPAVFVTDGDHQAVAEAVERAPALGCTCFPFHLVDDDETDLQ